MKTTAHAHERVGDAETFTPIHKTVTVKANREDAFRRFTAEIGTWWPLGTHSVGGADSQTVVMEPRVGGRIVEKIRGGRESVWGTITAWEPPSRVAFTWHPAREPECAQDIEVRFTADGARTRVDLEHRGFERLGALAKRARKGYPLGWTFVLGRYTGRRDLVMAVLGGLGAVATAVMRMKERRKSETVAA